MAQHPRRRRYSSGRRKRRTREHVISELSVNYLERQILRRGHQFHRMPQIEYGIDGLMWHFDDKGQVEDGLVYFQLKATDSLKVVQPKNKEKPPSIPIQIDVEHFNHWHWVKHHPVVLVVYDAANNRAHWATMADVEPPDTDVDSVTVHVPVKNQLTLRTIDRLRQLSLDCM